MTYSYSFEPNPYWSRLFAPGAELKRYAEHVADKYDLRRHMRFGTAVDGARWDEDDSCGSSRSPDGETVHARYLVTATGFLSQPHTPDIPGIDDFAGTVIHTAAWDDSHDLTGKRVAVIGTGATAVQLIPEIADVVDDADGLPADADLGRRRRSTAPIPDVVQQLFARLPLTQRIARLVEHRACSRR